MAVPRLRRSDDEGSPPPGVKRWLISCDETGFHGARFYGFGSVWMPWQRRGDFAALVQSIRDEHGYDYEIKWTKITPRFVEFYIDLIQAFFETRWLWFHGLLVEKAVVRREFHKDMDEAHRKHFTLLLSKKIAQSIRRYPSRQQTFRIWTDPIHSRYAKADEAAEIILENVLGQSGASKDVMEGVHVRTSHDTPSIQLSDLLLGAVAACREGDVSSPAKLEVMGAIAQHVSWPHLRFDTKPHEPKFNVWVFYDPTRGSRREDTRPVDLRHILR